MILIFLVVVASSTTIDFTGVALDSSSSEISIGSNADSSNPFDGYIEEVSIIKGAAKYQENFTVPTVPSEVLLQAKLPNNLKETRVLG